MINQMAFAFPETETEKIAHPSVKRIHSEQRTAPDDSGEWFQCFTLDQDETTAAALFESRFGYPPDKIFEEAGLLWIGPVK